MAKICPICKMNKLFSIDPIETRNTLKKLLNGRSLDSLPQELQDMVRKLNLNSDISESEKLFYEVNGKRNICQVCGFSFSDNEDVSKYMNEEFEEVTMDEYYDYIRSKVNDRAYSFIRNKNLPQEKYYLEVADQLIKEFEEVGLSEVKNDNFVN